MDVSATLTSDQFPGGQTLPTVNGFRVAESGTLFKLRIVLSPEGGGTVRTSEFDCSLDGTALPMRRLDSPQTQGELDTREGQFFISGDVTPRSHQVVVQYIQNRQDDLGTIEVGPLNFDFKTVDTTAPTLVLTKPLDNQVLVLPQEPTPAAPHTVNVAGTIRDTQSGLLADGLTFSFGPNTDQPVAVVDGGWSFDIDITSYGPYELRVAASDNSGNVRTLAPQFEVVPANLPQTMDDLLSSSSYLYELLRFTFSHVVTSNRRRPPALDAATLEAAFRQPFGALAKRETTTSDKLSSDLETPCRIIRDDDSRQSAGLIGRWSFDATHGVDVPDDFGRFHGLNGSLNKAAQYGRTGSDTEGALVLDGTNGTNALIGYGGNQGSPAILGVGKEDSDFSVSFWIRPSDSGTTSGPWRSVIYKGIENAPTAANRTFAIWLLPDSNALWYRITTTGNADDGGQSVTRLAVDQWSHVAYVKERSDLRLFINGRLDSNVPLSGPVVSNEAALLVGSGPPDDRGFVGALDELRLYGFALTEEDVEQLALDRFTGPAAAPVTRFHDAAYDTILTAFGTSAREMRSLARMNDAAQTGLAARLGITRPQGIAEALGELQPPVAFPPGSKSFDSWLEGMFGLPATVTPDPGTSLASGTPRFLQLQQQHLGFTWAAEDLESWTVPDLDPDLTDSAELNLADPAWPALFRARTAELSGQYAALRGARTYEAALKMVYTADEVTMLETAAGAERSGEAITSQLSTLGLDMAMFRQLIGYADTAAAAPLSVIEMEDLAHLLTQVWKIRERYPVWLAEEAAMASRLWPTDNNAGSWIPGSSKRDFPPWRGRMAARLALEVRLARRWQSWQAILDGHAAALDLAQRTVLPLLRDDLLGLTDLRRAGMRVDALTRRWLVDIATIGVLNVTAIEQATFAIQTLLDGVRNRRFEAGHPAQPWVIGPGSLEDFDLEWLWMSSLGRYRAAVMNYLHPESALFPELRPADEPTLGQPEDHEAFTTFLIELRKVRPVTSESLPAPTHTERLNRDLLKVLKEPFASVALEDAYRTLRAAEQGYFAPVAIALALQRAGAYSGALDWYRQVFDVSQPTGSRARAVWLEDEDDTLPPSPQLSSDANWTLALTDPHKVARLTDPATGVRFWGNPYTRYTLLQILDCTLSLADSRFADGSLDGRANALALYLEAKEILTLEELRDLRPKTTTQLYLPNPAIAAHRAHTNASLSKLRRGLSFSGAPLPPDRVRRQSGAQVSLTRPTPYRFKVLLERAKQLAAQAQQIETQYLAAIVAGEGEVEKLMTAGFAQEIAQQTVELRTRQETEASDGATAAELQRARTQIQADRYKTWIADGAGVQAKQLAQLLELKGLQDQMALIDGAIASHQGAQSASASPLEFWMWIGAAVNVGQQHTKYGWQLDLNNKQTEIQAFNTTVSWDQRFAEWQLQEDLANQDLVIGDQQIAMANDRVSIARQESLIANTQAQQAEQIVTLLTNKFANVEFYEWMKGVLAAVYAFFLRMATSTAQLAESQLAFERQQPAANLIKSDYWSYTAANQISTTPDRAGITGSDRLLQDLYALDQQAFSSDRRALNLSHWFSFARQMPVEFEAFRRSGTLTVATPMSVFDEAFPGHYMRVVRRVRISVVALIPPSQGIRATLTNTGLSRVVTAGPCYATAVIQQDAESVALTSPLASTGVFDLDLQSEMLNPFEGAGVDTTWIFELPPASNLFDYDSLADVVMTVDYTAFHSDDLRERIVRQVPRRRSTDIAFSARRDLPDAWYDLANLIDGAPVTFELSLDPSQFPPGLMEHSVDEIAVVVRLQDGTEPAVQVRPSYLGAGASVRTDGAQPATLIRGIASSRQSGGDSWAQLRGAAGATATWRFDFDDTDTHTFSLAEALGAGAVDDILLDFTISGLRPAWS